MVVLLLSLLPSIIISDESSPPGRPPDRVAQILYHSGPSLGTKDIYFPSGIEVKEPKSSPFLYYPGCTPGVNAVSDSPLGAGLEIPSELLVWLRS